MWLLAWPTELVCGFCLALFPFIFVASTFSISTYIFSFGLFKLRITKLYFISLLVTNLQANLLYTISVNLHLLSKPFSISIDLIHLHKELSIIKLFKRSWNQTMFLGKFSSLERAKRVLTLRPNLAWQM